MPNKHLAPYELERLERIERNREQLSKLGLDNFKLSKAKQRTNGYAALLLPKRTLLRSL